MSSSKPPWWRAFDRVERKVGKPLENAAASNAYVDVMMVGLKVQRKVIGGVGRAAGGAMGRVLRAVNVPTRGDVRNLSRQLTVLTGEVRALAAAQEASEPRRRTTGGDPTGRERSRAAASRGAEDEAQEAGHSD